MEQLIPVINRLQDAFALVEGGAASIGLDLPQIVVVGSQSSGKSSVLENVVGKDFLPRGSGIVTRRPLVLQLINTPKTGLNDSEWGEFLHLPGEKFTDFSQIREEIQKETDRLTGKNKGISPYPISLKVYSPNVLNLTLVDLPGITRVPIGDQPKDIESQIRRMILNYIEKPNSIILAVTAGNSDLTTSDALELAKSVDPEGKRTLGVITKLDLMDKGTDALDMLLGKIVPLKLGFIGVVNRSQKDINDRKTIVDAKKDEKEYFSNHPVYKGIASRLGTPFLASQLNKILMNHIKNTLPDIKQKINQMILETNDQLMALGDSRYDISPGAMLLQIINAFALSYTETIEGKLTEDVSVDELYGGARINYIFNEIFSKYLLTLQPLDGLSPFDIRTAVSNATGPKSALFVPEQAFELLVRRQLGRIKEPAIQCVDLVFDELERIVNGINSSELQRFRNLKEELSEAGTNLLRNCRAPTKEMINNVMSMEINFINTNHPDFQVDAIIGGVMKRRQDRMNPPQPEPDMRMQQQQQQQQLPPQLPVKQQQQSSNPVPMKGSNVPIKQDQMKGGYPSNSPPDQTNAGFFGMFFGKGGKGEMEISNPTNNPQQAMLNQQQYLQQQQQQLLRNQQQQQQQMQRQQQQKQQQQNYFNGNGSDGRPLKLGQVPSVLSVSTIPQEKQFEIELLEGLLEAYFNIVRKNIQDYVPKAIMYFMVAKSKSDMQNELIQKLYKETQFEHLLQEGSDIVSKRMTCKKNLDLLNKAQVILSEVREYNLSSNTKI